MLTGPQQVWLPVSGTLRGEGGECKGTGHREEDELLLKVEGVRKSSQVRREGCSAFLSATDIM